MRERAAPGRGRLFATGRHRAVDPLPPFAWWEVSAITLVAGALLFVRLDRYDFGGDELYFIGAGHHPAVSYADQGPLVPLLSAFTDNLAPGSTMVLRLPALLMTLAAIVLSALIAREFRGRRGPQTLAALAYAVTPAAVLQSAMLSTYALDATLTALVSWLFIRWVRTHSDYLLVLAGAVAALDFQVKWLIPIVWAAVALGFALLGPREVFRRPAWWIGSGLLAVSTVPAALWQHANDWPQLAMGAIIRDEQLAAGAMTTMPWQVVLLTGPIGVLLLAGLWAGFRSPRIEPYRFLIPVVALGMAGVIGSGLRPYYMVSAFPGLLAAGTVYLADVRVPRRVRTAGVVLTATATALCVTAVIALPLPQSEMRRPTDRYSQFEWRSRLYGPSGWKELVKGVDDAYRQVPTEHLPGLVLLTQNYWQAAALDHYGPRLGFPAVYSTNRGYAYFAPPPDSVTTILYVGTDHPETALGLDFAETAELVRLDDRLGYPGVNRHVSVWKCRNPSTPWSAAWPGMRRLPLIDGTTR
ncbi:glycosyltransferase family 39 protein [Nocardia sp. XZ_19_385]|uniref:ArnT family glycosyltransferase n=1 Tax=Nocardia sp. XZ_19_385 TaxID=2769488 RepID=UPI00188F0E65|nr:glycosyltransferase family 39 protein [Nocardia sp. XZ_19_385]